jgi:AcrR family transcriptional regulator
VDPFVYLGTLPRGRHGLSREQVTASQRGRLMLGMAEAVAEKGYAKATVADVLKRVHVSRETFYQHFADKEDCFLAAFEESARMLEAGVRAAVEEPGLTPRDRFERALTAYLELMAAEPAIAKVFLTEIYAAGPVAAARRFEVQGRWVQIFAELLAADERWRALPDPRFACRLVVGGIGALVTARISAGEHAALPALREPILQLIDALGQV